jgi:hypothetical protein
MIIYNYFTRHIYNIFIAFLWFFERKTFKGRPISGKITPDAIQWTRSF